MDLSDSSSEDSYINEDLNDDEVSNQKKYDSEETEDQVDAPNWLTLPVDALGNIYTLLSRNDQHRMSLVCKKWEKEYSDPSVWKLFKFYLPEHQYPSDIYPEVKFARKYGHMFKYVEIIYKRAKHNFRHIALKQLNLFLEAITRVSKLISIKFKNIGSLLKYLEDDDHSEVFHTLLNFVSSQKYLQIVSFEVCNFYRIEGIAILTALARNNVSTIRSITLKKFIESASIDSEDEIEGITESDNVILPGLFLSSRYIDVDYERYFEDVMNELPSFIKSHNRKSTKIAFLKKIKWECDGLRPTRYHGIEASTWKDITTACPDLRVDAHFQAACHPKFGLEMYLPHHIPLRFLDFRLSDRSFTHLEIDISFFFRYLVANGSYKYLEELSLYWMQDATNLVAELIEFCQVCNNLRSFQLYMRYPVEELDLLFKTWLQNRPPALETVYITITMVNSEEALDEFVLMADNYGPLLQVIGINLVLLTEIDPRHRR